MLSELDALVVLTHIRYLGPVRIHRLIQHFGSAQAALNAPVAEMMALPDFGVKIAEQWGQWRSDRRWKRDLELVEKEGVTLIPYNSPSYPKRLLEISDHPVLLYVQGQIKVIDQPSIAVVGTRTASLYGLEMADRLSQELAGAGFVVVSGLARGIDTAAHRGALRSGESVAVLGSGLSHIYPQENRELAHRLMEQGALISEFPMTTPPDRQNFPRRNRIVAAMTLGTVLVEAPLKSGAMMTVEKALSYRRKVFAIGKEEFKGNDDLLKRGSAQLIENGQEVIAHFGISARLN